MNEKEGWRQDLKKGDKIDIFKKEKDQLTIIGWSTGKIEDRIGESIVVSYDGEDQSKNKTILLNSMEINPFGSRIEDNSWRMNLKKGDIVDCLDTQMVWYKSTILERKSFDPSKSDTDMVLIGYRVYDDNGNKKDSEGKCFFGWSQTFDRWLKVYSLLIQKEGTIARIGNYTCKKNEEDTEAVIINDSGDILFNNLAKKMIYSLIRSEKQRSQILVDYINSFGESGGFDKILAKLNNRIKILSFGIEILILI